MILDICYDLLYTYKMNRIEQNLVQQMHISDYELNLRKSLLEFMFDDVLAMTSSKPYIVDNIDIIVDRFYENQTKIEEIVLLIGDADTLERLHQALRHYILGLFSGYYDHEYVNNRLRIGMVHKRIGVEPKLFLSAVRVLKGIIRDVLRENIVDETLLSNTLYALEKLFYFDTTFVFDTYIESLLEEVKSEKRKTELYAKSLEDKVLERTKQLEALSKLDPLTNLSNQRALYESLRVELIRASRNQTKLSLVYLDVDDFKCINDNEGHMKGDEVLKDLALLFKENIRELDIACRCGGDEFVLILPQCDIANAKQIVKKIIKKFSKIYTSYTLSFGIAETGTVEYLDSQALLHEADKKMYLAKEKRGMSIEY